MSEADEMATVLAHENTARMFVHELIKKGVTFNCDAETMTHEQCVDAVLMVMRELSLRERK